MLQYTVQWTPDYPGVDQTGSIWFKRQLQINLESVLWKKV
jgi:hypothetical protein